MAKIDYKQALSRAAASAAGGVAAASANKIDIIAKQKPVVRGILKMVIGALLPAFVGKGKHKVLAEHAGAGFAAVGGIELANGIITKNGTANEDKKISIGAAGDYDPNVMGIGNFEAEYLMDEGYDQGVNGVAGDENVM